MFFTSSDLFVHFAAEHALVVSLAGCDQPVDDTGQFMGGGCYGLGRSEAGSRTAVEIAQMRAAAGQRLGGDAQCSTGTAITLACFGRQHFASALLVGRAQGKPAGEGGNVGEAAEVRVDFSQQSMCGEGASTTVVDRRSAETNLAFDSGSTWLGIDVVFSTGTNAAGVQGRAIRATTFR